VKTPVDKPRLTDDDLARIEARVKPLLERKERAQRRFTERQPGDWCFGFVGVRTEPADGVMLGLFGHIRPVEEAPGEVGLAAAIKNKALFGAVGRYMPMLKYELVIPREVASNPQMALNLGWNAVAGLRLRSGVEFLVPVVADHSWATIEGAAEGSCWAQLLEDSPRARRVSTRKHGVLNRDDAEWVASNFIRLLELRGSERFHFALDCLSSSYSESNYRLMTASLWAGIEALVGINQELRFRLSALLASLIRTPGVERLALYQDVRKLYDMRSRAVHGAALSTELLRQHVLSTRQLLADCLIAIVELGRLPSASDLEANLLGVLLHPLPRESQNADQGGAY
jgi:hypothetical protein